MNYLKQYTFADETPFKLVCGRALSPVTIAYETWGELNADGSNAILLFHAFTGSSHAATHFDGDTEGWWERYVGPGKPFDTARYFIICANTLGSCYGTTGPSSMNPNGNAPYGLEFPFITIKDMVHATAELVKHLGITRLLAVAGGSMGGMEAVEWSLEFPDAAGACICIAATHSQSAQAIAFHQVGRQAIIQDPNWNMGEYYGSEVPRHGLSLARMIGHITYLSEKKMHEKFGRKLQDKDELDFVLDQEFQVESYLRYQGYKFVERFDANTYLYLTRAMDYFDVRLDHGDGNIRDAFEKSSCHYLMVSFSSDWLYPSDKMREMVNALRSCGRKVVYMDIDTDSGHDSFLLPEPALEQAIENFLKQEYLSIGGAE
jgi:homoserine O-acetyltransferase/O-succinyltransferase